MRDTRKTKWIEGKMTHRLIALVMSLVMCVQLAPTAWAAASDTDLPIDRPVSGDLYAPSLYGVTPEMMAREAGNLDNLAKYEMIMSAWGLIVEGIEGSAPDLIKDVFGTVQSPADVLKAGQKYADEMCRYILLYDEETTLIGLSENVRRTKDCLLAFYRKCCYGSAKGMDHLLGQAGGSTDIAIRVAMLAAGEDPQKLTYEGAVSRAMFLALEQMIGAAQLRDLMVESKSRDYMWDGYWLAESILRPIMDSARNSDNGSESFDYMWHESSKQRDVVAQNHGLWAGVSDLYYRAMDHVNWQNCPDGQMTLAGLSVDLKTLENDKAVLPRANWDITVVELGNGDNISVDREVLECIELRKFILNDLTEKATALKTKWEQSADRMPSRYSDETLAALGYSSAQMYGYLRTQLAQLRVWEAELDCAYDLYHQEFLSIQNGISDSGYYEQGSVSFLCALLAEAEVMKPALEGWIRECQGQLAKYIPEKLEVERQMVADLEEDDDGVPTMSQSEAMAALQAAENAVTQAQAEYDAVQAEFDLLIGVDDPSYEYYYHLREEAAQKLDDARNRYLEAVSAMESANIQKVGLDVREILSDSEMSARLQASMESRIDRLVAAVVEAEQEALDKEKAAFAAEQAAEAYPTDENKKAAENARDEAKRAKIDAARIEEDNAQEIAAAKETFSVLSGGKITYEDLSGYTEPQLYDYLEEQGENLQNDNSSLEEIYDILMGYHINYGMTSQNSAKDVLPFMSEADQESYLSLMCAYGVTYVDVDRVKGRILRAKDALLLNSTPVSIEDCENRFQIAFLKWYYANMEAQEYSELETSMIGAELNNSNSDRRDKSYSKNAIWANITQNALNSIGAGGGGLDKVAADAKTRLDSIGATLTEMEMQHEMRLSGYALQQRINEVQWGYSKAQTAYQDKLEYPEYRDQDDVDISGQYTFKSNEKTALDYEPRMLDTLAGDTTVGEWLRWCYQPEYIKTYMAFEMETARFLNNEDIRGQVIARIEMMGDQYAFQVNTGSTAGTGKILFFGIVYEDEDGVERKEYIFPGEDAYKMTQQQIKEAVGSADMINQEHIDTMKSLGQAGQVSEVKPLEAWSVDTYLFRTQYKMKQEKNENGDIISSGFKYFQVFGENVQRTIENIGTADNVNGQMSNAWMCTGMRLMHVDDFYGQSVYGYGGSDATRVALEFKGQQIGALLSASASGKMSYPINWVCDTMFMLNEDMGEFKIDREAYPYRSDKVGEGSANGVLEKVSDEESEYLFKLDFSDVYGAGIEGLVNRVGDKATVENIGLTECLTFQLVYYDINGARRQIRLPVISSSIAWAVDHGVDRMEQLFGYAQQDDSIAFTAYLPEMKEISLTESYLCFEYVDWPNYASSASSYARDRIAGRKVEIQSDTEIRLDCLQVFAPGTYQASATVERGVIVPHVEGIPMLCQVAGSTDGDSLLYGSKQNLGGLRAYREGQYMEPVDEGQKYMLTITTDDNDLAATTASPTISFEYVSESGRKVTSEEVDLQSAGKNFYGYWPTNNGMDLVARRSTGKGGQIQLIFDIRDVKYFDNIRISMPESTTDDWQISDVKIEKLTYIGPRYAQWEDVIVDGAMVSDRIYTRDYDGEVIMERDMTGEDDEKILIQPGEDTEIEINGANTDVEEKEDINWEDIRYYMDSETAQMDLGFGKQRATYNVTVTVGSEDTSNANDGDCGSINPFYFQLIFTNGKSGYVLANQQLSGDGFRTGYDETFSISTNRDYGELSAVRIIPDDASSNSQIFDKLNIKSIKVSRQSEGAVNRTWVIENVGWIEIDYHDDAESYSITGRSGRSESSLARNFNVDYATYSAKLLFILGTGTPDSSTDNIMDLLNSVSPEERDKIEKVLKNNVQFQGEVSMDLAYKDSRGNICHQTFNVVKAMADYAEKQLETQSITDDQGNLVKTNTLSDTSYMFRPEHVDRFEVEVRDVYQLVNARIIAKGADSAAFWKISSLGVKMITENGVLNINRQNEYQRSNSGSSAKEVCEVSALPFTMWVPAGHTETFQFAFPANEINVDLEDSTWEVVPPRVPESENDVANVYVYLRPDSTIPEDLMAQLRYATGYGQSYQTAMKKMAYDADRKMFYVASVDVGKIAVLNEIALMTSDSGIKGAYVERVVVQQIRSDVVINTYTFVPEGLSNGSLTGGALYIKPSGNIGSDTTRSISANKQVLTLGFGEGTEATRLVAENRDIAVALRYTSTNDNNAREYLTPYIYLTDQQIRNIASGSTAELIFYEPYLDTIKGLTVLCTGKLKVNLEMATADVYTLDEGTQESAFSRRYSFGKAGGLELTAASQTLKPCADSLSGTKINALQTVYPVTLSFMTGEISDQQPDPQTGDPVRMTIEYVDADGITVTKEWENIRNSLISGGFGAGETATIRVMLMGVKELVNIKLEPYSAVEDMVSQDNWYIVSRTVEMNQGANTYRHASSKSISAVQGNPASMNAANITMVVEAKTVVINNTGSKITMNYKSTAGAIAIDVDKGQEVLLTPTLTGSKQGFTVSAKRYISGDSWMDVTADTLTKDEEKGTYTFKSDLESLYNTVHTITFTSVEDPTVSEVVTITLKGSGVPFTLTENYRTMILDDELTLTVQKLTEDVVIEWTSSDVEAATVDETGKVKALAAGEVTITASYGGYSETCTIRIEAPESSGGNTGTDDKAVPEPKQEESEPDESEVTN